MSRQEKFGSEDLENHCEESIISKRFQNKLQRMKFQINEIKLQVKKKKMNPDAKIRRNNYFKSQKCLFN